MITRRTFLKTFTGAAAALALGIFPKAHRPERLVIAAADAPASIKRFADFQCRGAHDQLVIQQAVDRGHSIYLADGTYHLDEPIRLSGEGHYIVRSRFIGGGFEFA